jgi:uncharacterized protein (TIGR03083 family)
MSDQHIVDDLAAVWQSIEDLCATLTPEQWALPTDCPGWSVQDLLSHMVGTESKILGRSSPAHTPQNAGRLPNAIAERNEVEVDYRRSRSGAQVLAEFREVTAARLTALRAMPEESFAREFDSPLGKMPYREFLRMRFFDCWIHEQDMRRALGRPGALEGPLARQGIDRLIAALPYVVGKKVGAPDGATAVFAISGPVGDTAAIGMEGRRAHRLDDVPAAPTVLLTMDTETFICLSCGRWDPRTTLQRGRVAIAGDEALGRDILEQLNIMF